MRKHVLGFGIFNLIFASFALVYAFFSAPAIPPKETVKPPISQTETREERPYSCRMKAKKISYEVQSSELDIEKNQFTSQVTIYWNGDDIPPKQLSVSPRLFTVGKDENSKVLTSKTLVEPFKNGNKTTVTFISDGVQDNFISEDENIYVSFYFLDLNKDNRKFIYPKNLTESHQVLIIHNGKPAVFVKNSRLN